MPETLRHSAVAATLADPALVAYLCVRSSVEEHRVPELERHRWRARKADCRRLLRR